MITLFYFEGVRFKIKSIIIDNFFCSFFSFLCFFITNRCELAKRFLDSQYEKLAEEINSRDDLKLARVNCDEHAEFCKSQGVNGLAVHLYQPGEERLVFKGVKNMEGLSKFLIKSLGDTLKENIRKIPEKLDALNDLTEETFIDHIASGNHFIKFYAPWCGHCQVRMTNSFCEKKKQIFIQFIYLAS